VAKRGKRQTLEEEQQALSAALATPDSEAARSALAAALGSARSLVVARAARFIKEQRLPGFEPALKQAFARFLENPIRSDPGCAAKLAALEALDYDECDDVAPFLRAARHVQKEPAWGPPVDTAASTRARAIVALARIGHEDFLLWAADLLNDAEYPVRQAAADALAHRGERAGAALAALKIHIGDEEPQVLLAAMNALLALAPQWGLDQLRPLLGGADEPLREVACLALGQSRLDEALPLLLDALDGCARAEEREPLLRGMGLHRSERALRAMLELIAERHAVDAEAAIAALSVRRFEPGVAERVRAAARQNSRADLSAAIDESFPPQKA
jgi:HEAT repeat protein